MKKFGFLVALSVTLFCFTPQSIFSASYEEISQEFLDLVEGDCEDEEGLDRVCNSLEESMEGTQDPVGECRRFLEVYLAEIKSRYGVDLTIKQACQMVKDNIELFEFEMTEEEQALFFDVLDQLGEEAPAASLE